MSSNRSGLAATVMLVAVFAAGCGSQSAAPSGTFEIATAPPDPKLLTILNGQLSAQVSNDGTACLSVTFGKSTTAVIWPTGFTARGNPVAVYDADGNLFAVAGHEVKVGGGLVASSQSRKALGCSGISQTIVAGPVKPAEATPGSQEYADIQISDMQQIVNSFPTVFGGLWGDPATKVVTISIAPGADNNQATAAMAQIARIGTPSDPHAAEMPKKWRVGFMIAGPSLSELEVVRSKVTAAQPWQTRLGRHLVSWGIDPVHHVVNVGVDLITPTISQDASTTFGGLVILETSEPVHLD